MAVSGLALYLLALRTEIRLGDQLPSLRNFASLSSAPVVKFRHNNFSWAAELSFLIFSES
jgi:hypothetical protein